MSQTVVNVGELRSAGTLATPVAVCVCQVKALEANSANAKLHVFHTPMASRRRVQPWQGRCMCRRLVGQAVRWYRDVVIYGYGPWSEGIYIPLELEGRLGTRACLVKV